VNDDNITKEIEPAMAPTNAAKAKAPRKAKAKPAIEGKGKRSLNLSLDYETYQRLALHALDLDTTISAIVTQLANAHLRRVHLTRTAPRED
jgi:macrodomain Ter protein organizer (MatP/YcbG family)